jgi:hypothetical protein
MQIEPTPLIVILREKEPVRARGLIDIVDVFPFRLPQ